MKQFNYVIKDAQGLHARPAGLVVKAAQSFSSTIRICVNDKTADAKRLFSVMKLAAKCGQELRIEIEGEDEEAAYDALMRFCNENI